ncbi:hypothetical protein KAT36_04025 [Candidatus Pacearchaeota archaeon]|nr:hypothetical protein [Candidatus Pacearchaeota archaeon]
MEINIFTIIATIGLLSISIGVSTILSKKYSYLLLILGGICLEVYSIYIGDLIFIVLQGVFIVSSIYGLIKMNEKFIRGII